MKKKLFFNKGLFLLFILMSFSFNLRAATLEVSYGDFDYEIDLSTRTATLLRPLSSNLIEVDIPSTMGFNGNEYTVNVIGENAFLNYSSMTKLNLPKSITAIENDAFSGCNGLKKVNISDLSAWCKISFNGYYSSPLYLSHTLYLNDVEITNLDIPADISEVKPYAFAGFSSMKSLNMPSSIIIIGDRAFSNCSGITSVDIPDSVTEIGKRTFGGCSKLANLRIGNSVKIIGVEAFYECSSIFSVVIPNSLISISNSAFERCRNLSEIVLGSSVKEIGEDAFYDTNLKKIVSLAIIPPSVSITSVHKSFPNSILNSALLTIPEESFMEYLTTAWADFTLIKAGENNVLKVSEGDFYYRISISTRQAILSSLKNETTQVVIPSNILLDLGDGEKQYTVEGVGYKAFNGVENIVSVEFPNTITIIGDYSFSGCTGISELSLPDSLKSIGKYAFASINITNLEIPDSVLYIGENAFEYCKKLIDIKLGKSVISIGDLAFYYYSQASGSLKNITCYATTPPTIFAHTFPIRNNSNSYNFTLFVPKGSLNLYKNAEYWKQFKTIEEIGDGEEEDDEPLSGLYLRGTFNEWWFSKVWEFKEIDNNCFILNDKTIYGEFKIATEDWSIQYTSLDSELVNIDEPIKLTNNYMMYSHNMKLDDVYECKHIILDLSDEYNPTLRLQVNTEMDGNINVVMDKNNSNDIYNLQGVCLKRNASQEDIDGLAPGVYIVGGQKVFVK